MAAELFDFVDDLIVAAALILITSVIHAIGLDSIATIVISKTHLAVGTGFKKHLYKIFLTVFCVLGIFFLFTIHIWLWAIVYYWLEIKELVNLEDAVYFSTVTFTTLGFGDIVLQDHWRVLSGIEAANGIVMLGWSTALIFEIMTMLYPRGRK